MEILQHLRNIQKEKTAEDKGQLQKYISTLPMNLCLKKSKNPAGEYEVWSLKEIPIGVRFGLYQEAFNDINEHDKNEDFQWQVERIGEECRSNWLPYVKYCHRKQHRNMIAFHTKSGTYYITCKVIPANTKLLVYDQNDYSEGDRKNGIQYIENRETSERQIWEELITHRLNHIQRTNRIREQQQYAVSDNKVTRRKKFNIKCDSERIHTDQEPIECEICGKKFTCRSKMTVHYRVHTGEKPYECKTCGKTFGSNSYLKVHERIHTGEKPFTCNICTKKFIAKGYLNVHKRIHTGEQTFECIFCGEKFITRTHLIRHERVHTGQKPFQCKACGKNFKSRNEVTVHNRVHTGERPFECSTCGKKFSSKSYLNMHRRIHTGNQNFECIACGKKFITRSHLNIHERVHTGEKPFECNYCGKKFSSKGYLNVHRRIHTGERPFECNTCRKKFISRLEMTIHERIHTA